MPFWFALFLGNIFSVVMTGYFFVSWLCRIFPWWLGASGRLLQWRNLAGAAAVLALYGVCLLVFWQYR